MKRYRSILTTLTLFLFFISANGKPVTLTEVRETVYALLEGWDKDLEIKEINPRYLPDGELGYYMVNLGQNGWVMVSSDDVMRPVLAFSFENSITPEESWSDAARYLLNQYKQEISIAIKDPTLVRDERWDRTELPSYTKSAAAVTIDPLIDPVKWNQGSGWNMFCPYDEAGPGDRVYVGCVAVSMAQAMSVYEYPVKGEGIKSYVHEDYGSLAVNFDMEDPYEWDQMSASSADQYNARLLYHCAVTVEMDFGPSGSGAYVRNAASALKKYFNYSTNLKFVERADYEDEAWVNTLVDDLALGHPIVYRGNPEDGSAGHAWNVDGYYQSGSVDYFHMNFGWSGSQNGYYTFNEINPGSYDFTSNQGAIIGIAKPFSSPYDLSLSEMSISEDLPDSSFVADVLVEDEDPNNVYSFTCKGPFSVFLEDYGPASFYIEDMKLYTKEVFEYDEENPEKNLKFLKIIVEDQYGNDYTKDFEIAIEKAYYGPSGIALSDSSLTENQPVGTSVAKLLIEDEKETNSYSYTLYGPYNDGLSKHDSASFLVDGDTLRSLVVFDRDVADTCYLLIELVDSYGNELSRAFTIEIGKDYSGSTGIESITLKNDLIYPNPASHTVTLSEQGQNASLELYELATGRKIANMEHVTETMDVSGLKEGFYLILIRSEKGTLAQKLIIQR